MGGKSSTDDSVTGKFFSQLEELKDNIYGTQEERDAAEADIMKKRDAAAREEAQKQAEEEYQAELQRVQTEALKTKTANLEQQQQLNQQMQEGYQTLGVGAVTDPSSITQQADVAQIDTTGTEIDPTAGQAGEAQTGTAGAVGETAQVSDPEAVAAATVTPATVGQQATEAAGQVEAQQGQISNEALIEAITKNPESLAQLGLDAAQIEQIRQVIAPDALQVSPGELVEGSAVDMAKVEEAAQVQAAQADPSKQATVQGQMEDLMADFEGPEPPAWAAGAMRSAYEQMARRGLSASSMAGQAVVQAAMEAALPIAQMDAQTVATFELKNLSNRQEAALFSAQQRANFLQLDFNQEFQSRVANASRIAEVANINFTAEQQIALENARMAQTVDLANLDARNAKVMADAAAMTQLDLANLTNQQMAQVENAKSFLQMDMTNLSFRQQTELFKAQATQTALLSDQAAENAARQFNAASENQTNQFMANLKASVEQFNISQQNAMSQFDVSEANAMERFNSEQENMRDQFNAQNSLIIAQANAKWRQDVVTIDTAAQNEANMEAAKTANAYTAKALDQLWQRERDLMDYSFRISESSKDRALQLALADKHYDDLDAARSAEEDAAMASSLLQMFF